MKRRRYLANILLASCLAAGADVRADEVATALVDFVSRYCLDCHAGDEAAGDFDLEAIALAPLSGRTAPWEAVVRKLRSRQMPPAQATRPDEAEYAAALEKLTTSLDALAGADPRPGRTETFRRLTRTEYQNAIRDLLHLKIDAAELLPKDESSAGFDNVTVGELTPTLLSRYVSAAQKISRLAVGASAKEPQSEIFRVRPDVTQASRLPGLPLGTRGGVLIPYHFPQDGEYEINVRLMRDRNEEIEGLRGEHTLHVLFDRELKGEFLIAPPPPGENDRSIDADLTVRFQVRAGPHDVAATFLEQSNSLLESRRQPLNVHYNFYRHPRLAPAVYQMTIRGPLVADGPGDSPSRRRLFVRRPTTSDDQETCAVEILSPLLRRAYRRPIDDSDLAVPLKFFRRGLAEGGFDAGIEAALTAILVNPNFLFRVERDPPGVASGAPYAISDVELASRLSFFLWSSLPDDELLRRAEQGVLRDPDVLDSQVRRMLTDERSQALATNFADQWLYLRNLDSIIPDARLYQDFGDNLRQAMRRETELFFEHVVRDDAGVLDLVRADYTFLNERLAKHYGVPHVYGAQFRRVELPPESRRGGLLRHASILTVTSYATRTSPVLRGHWVLENLLGEPPPPPPPDVPALDDNMVAADLPVRQRLLQHRADPQCASCHDVMDPVGFALENFDAVGRWRELENGLPVDASGGLPGGEEVDGVDGLESGLLRRPELFVGTLTEKLLTYALGRGVDERDAPAVRRIVRDAGEHDYQFSQIVLGIVHSVPFQMRTAE